MGRKRTVLYRLNWDTQFYVDMMNGIGFKITEPVVISMDGSKERTLYGAQSPLYGSTYGDEQDYVERFRCQCGRTKSRQYEGEICPFCNGKVEYKESNINICGYITVPGDAFVIQPLYFRILAKAIGKDFAEIVYWKTKVDTNGNRSRVTVDDLDFTPRHPFYGIGLQEFKERYEEILNYYKKQPNKKNKAATFDMLLEQKDAVFAKHIPVYSTLLRPQSLTQDTFYYQGADKLINPIFRICEQLETCDPIEWGFFMMRLQIKVNKLWDYDFESMHGKDGIIRDMLLGGSLEYNWVTLNLCELLELLIRKFYQSVTMNLYGTISL